MKHIRVSVLCAVISCSLSSSQTTCKWFNPKKVSAFFGSYPYEAVATKEYALTNPGTLTIENLQGNITVKTEWKRNNVCLKATKRGKSPQDLASIILSEHQEKKGGQDCLSISTQKPEKLAGSLDYTLVVPANMGLDLSTEKGQICIQEVNGPVRATTKKGNISITQTTSTVRAQTIESGSIKISQAKGNIKAIANGNVFIADAQASIIAQVTKGNIETSCTAIQPTGRILLHTESGSIKLALPNQTSANFYGKSERGTLNCLVPVTIKPMTTTLTAATWKQLKKEVDGLIGSGEAEIHLCSRGNITVVPVATT